MKKENLTKETKKESEKVEKIAKVNFKNSAVLECFIDKAIYKLDSVKNFMQDLNETPNTEKVEKFCELVNNLIFNDSINESIKIFASAKASFIKNMQDHSINFFKNIMKKAYFNAFGGGLKIDKETHTETICDKNFIDKISTAKYFQYVIFAILTDNGRKAIRYDSISNTFDIVEVEICEGLEG